MKTMGWHSKWIIKTEVGTFVVFPLSRVLPSMGTRWPWHLRRRFIGQSCFQTTNGGGESKECLAEWERIPFFVGSSPPLLSDIRITSITKTNKQISCSHIPETARLQFVALQGALPGGQQKTGETLSSVCHSTYLRLGGFLPLIICNETKHPTPFKCLHTFYYNNHRMYAS